MGGTLAGRRIASEASQALKYSKDVKKVSFTLHTPHYGLFKEKIIIRNQNTGDCKAVDITAFVDDGAITVDCPPNCSNVNIYDFLVAPRAV